MDIHNNSSKKRYVAAVNLMKAGLYQQAEELLAYDLATDKSSIPFRMASGECARKQNNSTLAGQWYRSVLDIDPDNFAARCNYGSVMLIEKRYPEAEVQFREAIRINPEKKQVFSGLGTALLEQGRYSDAVECFSKARHGSVHDVQLDVSLLRALLMSKKTADVELLIQSLTEQFSRNSAVYNAIGNAFRESGDDERAKQFYVKALQIQPDNAESHYNLGCIMRSWNRLDEALSCFNNALRFKLLNTAVLVDTGEVLQLMGECDEAEKRFRKALTLDPGCTIAFDNLLVAMLYNPRYSVHEVYNAHREWGQTIDVHASAQRMHVSTVKNEQRVRVGYLSPDFCKHPTASFLAPVIKLHDRERFTVYCYCQQRYDDEKTTMFKKTADHWREISNLNDMEASTLIKNDQIDILVDCAGHMAGNRLGIFALHPALVQLAGFGYPSTTGLSAIDYRISDIACEPVTLQTLCTEKVLYMNNGFFTYHPPADAPAVTPLPSLDNGIVTFGSLHTTARLNREVIRLWAVLLNEISNSRLILFRTTLTNSISERIAGWFEEDGIELNRVTFSNTVPSGHYLSMYKDIDISIDTFPWSGHTTACESLWMGVPMVTFRGDHHAAAMVASLMERISLKEFVADSINQYIDVARAAVSDLPRLNNLRNTMRQRLLQSPVCENLQWVRELEEKYLQVLDR